MTCKAPKNTLKGRFSGSLTIAIIKKTIFINWGFKNFINYSISLVTNDTY